jgi:hypothetical protein
VARAGAKPQHPTCLLHPLGYSRIRSSQFTRSPTL